MKVLKKFLLVAVALASAHASAAEEKPFVLEKGFTLLFDGKTYDGWKVAERPEAFTIEDGSLVARGDRAHCFYVGKFKDAKFASFELRMDVMTKQNANGGIFFATTYQEEGWPSAGYEVQVNNTHSDWKKTGSLYNVVDNKEPFKDDEWMAYVIKVDNGKINVTVNGKKIVDDYEPEEGKLPKEGGTIALQAHDAGSVVFYKNIRIKPLR